MPEKDIKWILMSCENLSSTHFFQKDSKTPEKQKKKNIHTLFVQLIERMDLYVDTSGEQKLNLLLSCQIPLKSKGLGHILLD